VDGRWVQVLRIDPVGVPQVIDALESAGIRAHVQIGNEHVRTTLPVRPLVDPDTIWVAPEDLPRARQLLANLLEEGEERIRGHLRDLPGELAIGVCVASAVGFAVQVTSANPGAAWPWALGFGIALPLAWARLRRSRGDGRR